MSLVCSRDIGKYCSLDKYPSIQERENRGNSTTDGDENSQIPTLEKQTMTTKKNLEHVDHVLSITNLVESINIQDGKKGFREL